VLSRGQFIEPSHLYGDEAYERSIDARILRLRCNSRRTRRSRS